MSRPKSENPKNRSFRLRMNQSEFDKLTYYSDKLSKSKSKIIRESLQIYFEKVDNEKDKNKWPLK